jgi:hypothetical protein
MATIEPSAFLPVLRRHITGPLDVWMLDAVGEAAIEFCRQSELICLEKVVASAGAGELITVCDEPGMKSCNLLYLTDADDNPLESGRDYYPVSSNDISVLSPWSDVRIGFAVEPVQDAEVLPEVLFRDHAEAIAAGAAAILYAQPEKPWSDPKRAGFYQQVFTEGWRRAFRFRKEHAIQPKTQVFINPVRRREFF